VENLAVEKSELIFAAASSIYLRSGSERGVGDTEITGTALDRAETRQGQMDLCPVFLGAGHGPILVLFSASEWPDIRKIDR